MFVLRSKHQHLLRKARERGATEARFTSDRIVGEARAARMVAEQFLKRLGEDLNEARAEIKRLTDIIVEMKREGREVGHPVDEQWGAYTTAEADAERSERLRDPEYAKRTAQVVEDPESHEQQPTTDGGAHTGYTDMVELERAAKTALEADLPDMGG